MAEADRRQLAPALTASAVLHAAVVGAGLIAWPWMHKIVPVTVTPVTLLTSADLARLTAAQRSETPSPAQAPEPEPEATPTPPPAPTPAPVPTPAPPPPPQPKAEPAPKPVEKAPSAKPVPAPKTAPTPPAKSFDLEALAKSFAQNTKAASPTTAKSTAAAKGPPKPETDLSDRIAQGQARATSNTALSQIRDKLIKLWNPNCGLESAANVHVLVRMNLGPDGSLAGRPQLVDYPGGVDSIADPVLKASAIRALSAVSRGAPYDNLPKADYNFWKTVALNFDAKQACGGQ